MSERTPETVRAELQEVEERLRAFEMLVDALEDDQVLLRSSVVADRLVGAIPGLGVMAEVGDRRAGQAAEEAGEMLRLLQGFLPGFEEKRRGLSFVLRRGLIPSLQNRRYALRQELAALEPPEPGTAGLFERVMRAARDSLALRLRSWA